MRTLKNSNNGFSMIELMVVIALVAILIAMSFPNFKEYNESRKVEGAARRVMSEITLLRTIAVGQNRNTQIIFDVANSSYSTWLDLNDNEVFEGDEIQKVVDMNEEFPGIVFARVNNITTLPLYPGQTFSNVPAVAFGNPPVAANTTVSFRNNGTASNSGFVFVTHTNNVGQTSTDRQIMVAILRLGSVSWWRHNGTSWYAM